MYIYILYTVYTCNKKISLILTNQKSQVALTVIMSDRTKVKKKVAFFFSVFFLLIQYKILKMVGKVKHFLQIKDEKEKRKIKK